MREIRLWETVILSALQTPQLCRPAKVSFTWSHFWAAAVGDNCHSTLFMAVVSALAQPLTGLKRYSFKHSFVKYAFRNKICT